MTLAAVALLASVSLAQQPRVVRPEDFMRGVKPLEPEHRAAPVKFPERPVEVPDATKVLVDELLGVRFVPDPADVQDEAGATGVTVVKIPLLDNDAFRERIKPYLGKPVTMKLIGEIIRETVGYYQGQDRPVVDVFIPEQEITKGVVQLLVIEARVGDVRVEGAEWFTDEQIRDAVRLSSGDVIRASSLLDDINYLNRNPFLFTRPVLEPGEEFGTTDVIVEAKDRLPIRVYAGYEDTGSRATGLERIFFGGNLGNLWNAGHEAGYQYTTSPRKSVGIHSAYYRIPLPNRDKLAFFGNYAEYDTSEGVSKLGSTNWMAHVRYITQLPETPNLRHGFEFGFDFRRADNNLQVGGTEVYDDYFDVAQFAGQYGGRVRDRYGDTSYTFNAYWSPCENLITSHQDDERYEAVRQDSDPEYFYAHAGVERWWILPKEWEFYNRLTGQWANKRLPPTELLGVGGYNSVRGFDDREVNTDNGLVVSFELRTPRIDLGIKDEKKNLPSYLQLLAFFDYGYARNRGDVEFETKTFDLASVGAGIRVRISDHAHLRFDYGHKLENVHNSPSGDGRVHVFFVLSY